MRGILPSLGAVRDDWLFLDIYILPYTDNLTGVLYNNKYWLNVDWNMNILWRLIPSHPPLPNLSLPNYPTKFYIHDPQLSCRCTHGELYSVFCINMMTSSNRNIIRVTGHFCGIFTGHRLIPHTRPVTRALVFSLICAWINGWVKNRKAGDLRRHRAHYDVIAMIWERLSWNMKVRLFFL